MKTKPQKKTTWKQRNWHTKQSKMVLNHPFFKVRADAVVLPNGVEIPDYTVWEHADVAQVIPITAEGKYILVKQYKHGLGRVIREFPGGFIEKNEPPIIAAERELREETGYRFSQPPIFLGTFSHHPTKETGRLHLYLAKDVVKPEETEHLKPDTTENIEVVTWTAKELKFYLDTTPVVQTTTLLGFLLAERY